MGKRFTAPMTLSVFLWVFIIFSLGMGLPSFSRGAEKTFRNSLGMEFVLIPEGTFVMGSPASEAYRGTSEVQHRVRITRSFYMQITEVTLEQWRAVMGKRLFGRRRGPDDLPVTRISWHDCRAFLKKLNARNEGRYRLPTEAEWEYACRAGTSTAYSWGNLPDCRRAMYGNSSKGSGECLGVTKASKGLGPDGPAPVRRYPPNRWGLYDMHGNVWEWCSDWYGPYRKAGTQDPTGPPSGPGKVRRGGSWFKHGHACRSANRNYGRPPTRYRTTGMRLVREMP